MRPVWVTLHRLLLSAPHGVATGTGLLQNRPAGQGQPGDCQDVHYHNLEQPRGSACITTILWERFSFCWLPACPSTEFRMLVFTSKLHSSCSQL